MSNLVLGGQLAQLGNINQGYGDITSSFLTGVLAVIVASPCTAPFMGSAVGIALLQPGFITIAIFVSLGFGFAAPYLLLSSYPSLLKVLPAPIVTFSPILIGAIIVELDPTKEFLPILVFCLFFPS